MSRVIITHVFCPKPNIPSQRANFRITPNLKICTSNCKYFLSVLNEKNFRCRFLYYHILSNHLQCKHVDLSYIVKRYCNQTFYLENVVNNPKVKKLMENLMLEYKLCVKNDLTVLSAKMPHYLNTSQLLESKAKLEENIASLEELASSGNKDSKGDDELTQLVEDEKKQYENKLKCINVEVGKPNATYILIAFCLDSEILNSKQPLENCNGVVMEISAGVGGQEAMLFAKDLYTMYCGYINFRGWTMELADYDSSDLGGIRHASLLVYGREAYKYLHNEGGVHRVQRIPMTEKSGRIHTSTITVAVFPQPEEVDVVLNDKDLKIEAKRASGAGGQHVNTTDSAIRIVHLPSGIAVECQKERSQLKNKQIAMQKLRAKLYEIQINEQQLQINSSRKFQVGTSGRSEKIRTYNFNQDRITDHRLSSNAHNLLVFLQGEEPLHELIKQILETEEKERIDDFVKNITS